MYSLHIWGLRGWHWGREWSIPHGLLCVSVPPPRRHSVFIQCSSLFWVWPQWANLELADIVNQQKREHPYFYTHALSFRQKTNLISPLIVLSHKTFVLKNEESYFTIKTSCLRYLNASSTTFLPCCSYDLANVVRDLLVTLHSIYR